MSTKEKASHKETARHSTIDPPAAHTAERARARREALLMRLEEEQTLRHKRKQELDSLIRDHNSNMRIAKFETSIIPTG